MLMKAVMPKKFQLNVIPDFRTFLFPDGGEKKKKSFKL